MIDTTICAHCGKEITPQVRWVTTDQDDAASDACPDPVVTAHVPVIPAIESEVSRVTVGR